MTTQTEIATALGITKGRCSQLVKQGMPTDSIESAKAWRASRKESNIKEGFISQPVRPINLSDLDSVLSSLSKTVTSDTEMDLRIRQQVDLCEATRTVFLRALEGGDPAQGKLYSNYDRAIATLLRLEKERTVRLMQDGRLVDADEASARFGKVLGQLRSLIERAELTVAPKANPDNPPKALKAFREFRDDLFRKISEYNVQVEDGSPAIGEDTIDGDVIPTPEAVEGNEEDDLNFDTEDEEEKVDE